MSTDGGSEDLYAVLSAHYPDLLNSTPKEKQQVVSKKRSWDSAIIPSMQLELELDNQYPPPLNTICSEREIHIWTERKRRMKMSCMLNTLLSLLPAHHGKIDKARIIEKAINYIKTLQRTLNDLQAEKSEAEASLNKKSLLSMKSKDSYQDCDAQIPLSLTMVPNSCDVKILGYDVVGNHAFTTIWAPQQTGFLPKLIFIMDANQLEIVDCTLNTEGCNNLYTLHVM
ncbi:hypothetical protein KI387_028203, partial [Taxus chinensis]